MKPVDPHQMPVSSIAALLDLCPSDSMVYATKNVFVGEAVNARRESDGAWALRSDGRRMSSRRLAEMVHGLAWSVQTPQYGGVP